MNAGRKGPRFHGAALADNAAVAERVLERIRAEGPLSSRDFERETGPTKDWVGMPENAVRAVLDFVGMPLYMAINAYAVSTVMREAKVVILGQTLQ